MSWLTNSSKSDQSLDGRVDNMAYQLSLMVNSHGLDVEAAKHIIKYHLDNILTKCREDGFDWLEVNQ